MKRSLLSLAFLIGFVFMTKADGYKTTFAQISETTARVECQINDLTLRPVNLGGTDFTKIGFSGRVTTMDEGFAELPFINVNIQLDPLKNLRFEIVSVDFTEYSLDYPLIPSRGVIYRNQDPSSIPYRIAPESLVDAFYPAQLIQTTEPYIIKDARGMTVYIYPFQYNAAQQILRVYSSITLQLVEDDSPSVNPLLNPSGRYFAEMEALYQSLFINYQNPADYPNIGEAGDILVITTARDEAAIQPYLDWKKEKGYNVFKEVAATGTNVKSLIQQKYNANPGILYVQLVGDWADIKSDLGGGANAPMDPMLGCVAGSDIFPDIAIGRFSASAASQVTVQVNKAINYEKSPSGVWYDKALSVASQEGAGIGDDGEIDYQHTNIIYNNKLDPFTYNGHNTAYEPTATILQVKNAIESGVSVINYCGHGSMTSWGTTGFSNTNVNQLTNGSKLPFIFSVACVNGAFHSGECFAEAWLKKDGGGAVWTIMATINQPWQPPMRGQDYFNDILTGGYNYTTNPGNGINTTEGRSILGSIVVNGLVLMYTESASTSDLQTMQTWTIFGDAALQARTMTPKTLALTNTSLLTGFPFETIVTANGTPVRNALVSLSQNENFVRAYTNQSGAVSIPNNFVPGNVLLVVTAFNGNTIYQTIQCTPAAGPAIYFDNVTVNDVAGNNNNRLDYGETAGLNVRMKNSGVSLAENVTVTLSTTDNYITLLNGATFYGNIPAGKTVTVADAFTVQAAANIPDNHSVLFNLVATSGGSSWQSSFSLVVRAGVLAFDGFYILDPAGNNNGKLDPGETATIVIKLKNSGGADLKNVTGLLTSASPFITIQQTQIAFGNIAPDNMAEGYYTVSVSMAAPVGHVAQFTHNAGADFGINISNDFSAVVGQIPVLIIDLDPNHNSWDKIATALTSNDVSYEIVTTFPASGLELYSSLFVLLGIYSNNYVLTAAQGQTLAGYLNQGGKIYMEGGDTWYYDAQTAVHPMFKINATGDGSSDLGTINGHAGTFTAGMNFTYSGDNNWIDRLTAATGATLILSNLSPSYGTAVAYNGNSYKTIGASHEFGGLQGNRSALMEAYLDFFGLLPPPLNTQTILIPAGWSGISSCLIPANSQLETFLQPILGQLTILQGMNGIFYPEANVNTLGFWNYDEGYRIKLESVAELQISGWEPVSRQLDLTPGWNMIPVLSECNVNVAALFTGISQVQIVKEIAGTGVYWPEMNINTLGTLKPGNAYMVRVTGPASVTFPACED